jgi:ectoine hydroxylase-related dioxygenase (phytanoyl-CoA dioxygenase family)
MAKFLSPEQAEQYSVEGYLSNVRVLSSDERAAFRERSDELEELMGGKPKALRLTQMHLSFRWAYELAAHPRVLDAVEDLIGPDILIWATSIFAKQSRDPAFVSWHQDSTYWGLSSTNIASAWVALAPSTPENGCMRVVPGSHKRGLFPHIETYAADNMLSRGQEVQIDLTGKQVVNVVLQAGEMSLHHVWLVHGSNPNISGQKRVGFVIRYISPDVRQLGEKPKAILVRGHDCYGHYHLVDPPPERTISASLEAHEHEASEFLASVRRAAAI